MSRDPTSYGIRVTPERVRNVLAACIALLIAAHVALQCIHYELAELPWLARQLFDVDEEQSFPTWYSAAALCLAAVLVYATAVRKRQVQDRWRLHWYGLAFGFALLSIDEIAGMHETLNTAIEGSWTLPAAIGVAFVAGIYGSFWWNLPRPTRISFLIAGIVFVGGAVGVERASDWYLETDNLDTLAYNLVNVAEEGFEMVGIAWFIVALLRYMGANALDFHVLSEAAVREAVEPVLGERVGAAPDREVVAESRESVVEDEPRERALPGSPRELERVGERSGDGD